MHAPLTPVHAALLRALTAMFTASSDLGWIVAPRPDAAPGLTIESIEHQPWMSATYAGERHRLSLRLRGPMARVEEAADAIERLLDGVELDLDGQLFAGADVVGGEVGWEPDGSAVASLMLEVLTLTDL